eukprot:GHRR01022129.1.p1 GENE.GHRR01022129.1~~GHRR01022129.1.p1  ORF type:complete len:174 (+),score=45.17 GHRR01022129.1:1279-1800(+)
MYCMPTLKIWCWVCCRVQAMLGNFLSTVIPKQKMVPAVNPNDLHPDPAVVKSFREDPLVCQGNIRVNTGNQLLKAMNHLSANRKELTLPMYVVHGTKDAVTSIDAIEGFTKGVSSKDLTFKRVEGGYHEMLMGDERIDSADNIIDWMRQRVGKSSQQAAAMADAGTGNGGSKL